MSDGKPYAKVIAPFKYEHLELMDLRAIERAMVEAQPEKYAALAALGDGGTLVHNGVVLASFGFLRPWDGIYEVWVIPSVHVPLYPRIFLRTVRCYVDRLFETHPVRRLQSPALADRLHDKWMRHLGFVNETPTGMPQYGADGRTFNMWARYR